MSKIVHQKISDSRFEFAGTYTVSWLVSAETLHYSSRVLWKNYLKSWKRMTRVMEKTGSGFVPGYRYPGTNILNISQLLAGLSLENLIKCILIRKNPSLIDSKSISKKLGTHNLERLFTDANQKVSAKESELLNRLSVMVVWGGKYPIPRESGQYKNRTMNGSDFEAYQKIYRRLKRIVRSYLKKTKYAA